MAALSPYTRTPAEARAMFKELQDRADVAMLLQVPLRFLTSVLYRSKPDSFYRRFEIKRKGGGTRIIAAPTSSLYILQARLNRALQAVYVPRPCSQGFIEGRSVVTNAAPHVGRRHVLNVDLENFFPALHFGRVRGMFMAKPFHVGENAATTLAQLACFNGALPIGSPTSPVIANMIAMKLDGDLMRLARRNAAWYTRYADDLTFSTDTPNFPRSLAEFNKVEGRVSAGDQLKLTIESNGFMVNRNKTRLQSRGDQQVVTGLVVNERVNVNRRYVRKVRAMLHSLEVDGLVGAQAKLELAYSKDRYPGAPKPRFLDVIRGKLGYLEMVRGPGDAVARRFRLQLDNLLAGRAKNDGIEVGVSVPSQEPGGKHIFISYVHEDLSKVVAIEDELIKVGLVVWRDVKNLWPGEKWKVKIRQAIEDGAFAFLPCFSEHSVSRRKSGMFKELSVAADEYREHNPDIPWIFPVLLDDVQLPSYDLGAGQTLEDLQWARLFSDWKAEMARLVTALQRLMQEQPPSPRV